MTCWSTKSLKSRSRSAPLMTSQSQDVIEQIKAQIDSEIAANRLPPGTSTMLPLELPPDEALSDEIGEHLLDRDEDRPDDFSHRDTVPELPSVEELLTEASEATEEPSESAAAEDVVSAVDDHADAAGAESASEPLEERATQPTVRTLSDWMPPSREIEPKRDEPDELADVPGPSFDLPNVPLTPNNGPTVEFDPDMSVGPAAESEFALDDVDFDAMSDEAAPVDEEAADEPSVAVEETIDAVEESAPVFQEPTHGALPATPFVLPGVPPVRKKRSVVRTLVGTALGGVVGTLAALYILLFLLGPGGDLLHVAPYLPSAMLPASFSHKTTQVADATNPAPAPQKTNTEPADTAVDGESTNVQAGYVADATPPAESTSRRAAEKRRSLRHGTVAIGGSHRRAN